MVRSRGQIDRRADYLHNINLVYQIKIDALIYYNGVAYELSVALMGDKRSGRMGLCGLGPLPFNNAAVEEFEVAAGAGLDVVHGVVGAVEVGIK